MRKVMALMVLGLLVFCTSAYAGIFNSGSTGADGAFSPSADTELQLPDNGIFNFSTVNIPAGVTVTFKKNALNTPVYMLATGDVTISGTMLLNGSTASGSFSGEGGAGGYSGGFGGLAGSSGGNGLGPGGGNPGSVSYYGVVGGGGGAGFAVVGGAASGYGGVLGGKAYSNNRLIPMIGGSGGGGGAGGSYVGQGGGGGAGALLIASSGKITIAGTIKADGGNGGSCLGTYAAGTSKPGAGGGGSGGAVKIMGNKISGNGSVSAMGGVTGTNCANSGGSGSSGRIRFEGNDIIRTADSTPSYSFGYPSTVFTADIPALKITSIGSIAVPSNPGGSFGTSDVNLPSNMTNPVTVIVSGTNIPIGTTVTITSTPEFGGSSSATSVLSGAYATSTATGSITISTQYQNIFTASATFTIQTAMYYDGEKIDKVRVASNSETTYITSSGKEVSYEQLMAKATIR